MSASDEIFFRVPSDPKEDKRAVAKAFSEWGGVDGRGCGMPGEEFRPVFERGQWRMLGSDGTTVQVVTVENARGEFSFEFEVIP